MKIHRGAAAVALGALAGALALAGPAAAHHNMVAADAATDGCQVTITGSWVEADHQVANAAVAALIDGEVKTAPIGTPLTTELPAGTTNVSWRVWGGGERGADSPPLASLDELLAYLDADDGHSPLDAAAPGIAWHELTVTGCPDPSPSPAPSPTVSPTPGPTSSPTAAPTESPDGGGQGGQDGDGAAGGLPVTGTSTALLAGGAVALLALGGGLYLVARRRRVTFTTG